MGGQAKIKDIKENLIQTTKKSKCQDKKVGLMSLLKSLDIMSVNGMSNVSLKRIYSCVQYLYSKYI